MNEIKIWTDGSASVKPPCYGGFGIYIKYLNKEKCISKGFIHTKTGRMEVMALLYAIRLIKPSKKCKVQVYSDSQYVVYSFTQGWLDNWKRSNWLGVKNIDLWKQIVEELNKRPLMDFNISWVKGHQKNLEDEIIFGNNVADALADYKNKKEYQEDLIIN